jgi:lipoprotein-releasing system ATP-binding protein
VAEALVLIEQLKKSFVHEGRTLDVLRGIDLNIYPGQILAIVGPSGAGKSTLLHCMGTLDLPSSGRIRLAGEELTTMSGSRLAAVRNRTIGFVFQFHHLLPEFTALENVSMPGLIQGRSKKEMEKRAQALLEEVGLAHRVSHRPGELSGGEQQRVAVARAFVTEPRLLFADEPTGNLDADTGRQIMSVLEKLHRESGQTIIMVTHDRSLARQADRVLVLKDGKLERADA